MPISPDRLKARYAQRKRDGLCTICGKPKVAGSLLCTYHRDQTRRIAIKHAKSPKAKEVKKTWLRTAGRFKTVSSLARRIGKDWQLSEETWKTLVAMPCFYCGLDNNSIYGSGLDRLDNSKGYVEGNIVSCCKECNSARMDNFSPEEMRVIGRAIREVKLTRKK